MSISSIIPTTPHLISVRCGVGNGTYYYYILNLQGDVIRIIDGSGITVAAYEYDPYGKILSATGSMANINPLRYRGYYYDNETQLYYCLSRYYDPQTGRFISADSCRYLPKHITTTYILSEL